MGETATKVPIFSKYSFQELHEKLGVGYAYLESLEKGTKPIRPTFKFHACAILGQTEEELFGNPGG